MASTPSRASIKSSAPSARPPVSSPRITQSAPSVPPRKAQTPDPPIASSSTHSRRARARNQNSASLAKSASAPRDATARRRARERRPGAPLKRRARGTQGHSTCYSSQTRRPEGEACGLVKSLALMTMTHDAAASERMRQALLVVTERMGVSAAQVRRAFLERDDPFFIARRTHATATTARQAVLLATQALQNAEARRKKREMFKPPTFGLPSLKFEAAREPTSAAIFMGTRNGGWLACYMAHPQPTRPRPPLHPATDATASRMTTH